MKPNQTAEALLRALQIEPVMSAPPGWFTSAQLAEKAGLKKTRMNEIIFKKFRSKELLRRKFKTQYGASAWHYSAAPR